MTNEEMEALLRRTGERMPSPSRSAPRMQRRRPRLHLGKIAAALAMVLLCSVTVYAATTEVPVPQSSEVGQWTGLPCSPGKYGLKLEATYGELTMTSQQEMWCVPHRTTYLEALFDAAYRAGNFTYRGSDGWVSITAGKTDHPYWRTYFSMDESGIPTNLHELTAETYGDCTLYSGRCSSGDGSPSWTAVTWVDAQRGYAYSISFHGVLEAPSAALEFAKQIIDART